MRAFSVELIKIRRTKAIAAAIGAPAFVAFVALMIHLNYPEKLIESDQPWVLVFRITNLWGLLLSTLIISLVCYLVNNVEHKGNAWKHMYALPVQRGSLYFGKLLVCLSLSLLSIIVLFVLLYFIAFLMAYLYPEIAFSEHAIHSKIIIVFLKLSIASFVVVQLQFLISKVYHNFMIPLGVGILATFSVIALQQWKYIYLFPYAFTNIVVRDLLIENNVFWQVELILSVIIGLILLLGGLYWNQKRDIA